MPYTMTRTAEHLAVAERQFCRSNMIKFTGIDSCLGILARKDKLITGAHLVLMYGTDPDITEFAMTDVPTIVSIFDEAPYDEMWFVGDLSGWNTTIAAFAQAKNWFTDKDGDFEFEDKKGILGARISSTGKMVLHHRVS